MNAPDLRHALAEERSHHDHCRTALAAMVEGAHEQVVVGEHASASGADAEVLGYELRSRAKEMAELPEGPLFFGRIDFAGVRDSEVAGDHRGQSYHIGRLRITEHPAAPPLVVDWRAPVSRAFYRASAHDPQGVAVRRRFGWAPGSRGDSADLTGYEDELLGQGEELSGPSALLAEEIERPRVGPMRDIAATIQPEQDELVRGDLGLSVCVQGAPGTGKTAVGLHRAAYLLYTYPQRIRRGGLLILGPNRTFLAYIAEVLPSLGETGVRQSTVDDEIARHPVRAVDEPRAAAVKHDARMARVLHRALYARVALPADSLAVVDGSYRWRVSLGELERIVADVRDEAPAYATGRERVQTRVLALVRDQAERRSGTRTYAWLQKMGRQVRGFLDAVWPKVTPEEVLAGLLADPAALAAAAEGILTAGEQQALVWAKPPRSFKSAKWSAADLVLLDELAGLIEHPEGYGHIVLDEAQDLSPMQARVIARRARFGSLTVLGDLAQGTTPWAARNWPGLLAHLGKPDAEVIPLTTGFRVPEAVVELANRLLGTLDVMVPAARSLRRDGELRLLPGPDVVAAAVEAAGRALERDGSVGVIAADAQLPVLRAALTAAGFDPSGPEETAARLTLLPASLAKGLEYDHVVVVEPAAIAEAEERGRERLYVALTRAVSRLDVVHGRELPF
ncbi:HelD family protein [Streptomyces indicus]|uniref:DNA helicase IV n=1 Tax=Streptomyces indicus TaxID=417292 RepID=A0A1G9HAH1_9ACTN|nr:ATP-binding domain-containing protein [Streptomyces indicus]SDL09463.1 DNA helicase IV [Streptomyces indicus]